VALVEGKLVQHRLKWFGHIKRWPMEALVRSGVKDEPVMRGEVGDDQT
jgi:hypothetical protein